MNRWTTHCHIQQDLVARSGNSNQDRTRLELAHPHWFKHFAVALNSCSAEHHTEGLLTVNHTPFSLWWGSQVLVN
jgi:hypothetical protein